MPGLEKALEHLDRKQMKTSDANSILADQVKDCGLEYVGKVIEGMTNPNPFVRNIFEKGINEREICVAKASIALFNLTMRYGRVVSMTIMPTGVHFERAGHTVLVDWLSLLEAFPEVIEQQIMAAVVGDALFPRSF